MSPGDVSIQLRQKGGSSRDFVFTMDNGQHIFARLPFALAGPPRLTTQSEAALICYNESKDDRESAADFSTVQANTSIPIPKIVEWCGDTFNSIRSEYMIMEHFVSV